MPQFEPHSPKELRAQVKFYFGLVYYYLGKQDEYHAALNARRLAHFGARLLAHPKIQKEFETARMLAVDLAKVKTALEYEKAVEEADAAVVARLTAPQEEDNEAPVEENNTN